MKRIKRSERRLSKSFEIRGRLAKDVAPLYYTGVNELVFDVSQEADGGYCAECLTESIVTESDTWNDLRMKVREAVRGYYFDQPEKQIVPIRLHQVRDEILAA